jgi:O-antigen/teichoic acid export membrane protein
MGTRLGLSAGPPSPLLVAGQLFGSQLAVAGFSLAVNILSARTMGPAGRGAVALGLQLAYVCTALAMAGVDRMYPASVPEGLTFPDAVRDLRRLVIPGSVAVAGGFLAAGALWHQFGAFAAVAGAVTVGNTASVTMRTAAAAAVTGRFYLRASLSTQILLVAGAVGLSAAGVRSPVGWLALYAITLAGPSIVVGAAAVRRAPEAYCGDRALLRRVRLAGFTVVPATLSNVVMLRSDRLLLPVLASYGQLGVYVIVATLTELVAWPVQSYVDAHLSGWHAAHLSGYLRRARILLAGTGYAMLVCASLAVVVRPLIVPVFGAQYRAAVPLVWPLALGAGLYAVSRLGVGLALAAHRSRAVLAIDVSAMAVAVACYLLLIPRLGALGAALGSLCGYAAAAVAALLLAVRVAAPAPATGTRPVLPRSRGRSRRAVPRR